MLFWSPLILSIIHLYNYRAQVHSQVQYLASQLNSYIRLFSTHRWVFNVVVLENPGTYCWTNCTLHFWLILLSVLTSKIIQPGTQLRVPPSDPSRTELLFAKNPPSLLWFAWTCNKYSWISIFSRSSRCLK